MDTAAENCLYQIDFSGTNKAKIAALEDIVDERGIADPLMSTSPDDWLPVRLNWYMADALASILGKATGTDGQRLTVDNDSVLGDLVDWLKRPSVRSSELEQNPSAHQPLPEGGFHVWQDVNGNFQASVDDGALSLSVRAIERLRADEIVTLALEHDYARDGVVVDGSFILNWGFDWCTTKSVLDAVETTWASQEITDRLLGLRTRMVLWTAAPHRVQSDCGHRHGSYELG